MFAVFPFCFRDANHALPLSKVQHVLLKRYIVHFIKDRKFPLVQDTNIDATGWMGYNFTTRCSLVIVFYFYQRSAHKFSRHFISFCFSLLSCSTYNAVRGILVLLFQMYRIKGERAEKVSMFTRGYTGNSNKQRNHGKCYQMICVVNGRMCLPITALLLFKNATNCSFCLNIKNRFREMESDNIFPCCQEKFYSKSEYLDFIFIGLNIISFIFL